MTCFCNLETFLTLEFEAGKQVSTSGHLLDEDEEVNDNDSMGSDPGPFNTAVGSARNDVEDGDEIHIIPSPDDHVASGEEVLEQQPSGE